MIEQAIMKLLLAQSSITNIVDDRIRCDKLLQGDVTPNIVIELPGDGYQGSLDSGLSAAEADIIIRIRGNTRSQVNKLSATIRNYLDGILGETVGEVYIHAIYFDGDSDDVNANDATDSPDYVRPIKILVHYE